MAGINYAFETAQQLALELAFILKVNFIAMLSTHYYS